MTDIVEKKVVVKEEWRHPRTATISEVVHEDGRVRYHVDVTDWGRDKPFLHQEYGRQDAAEDFLYEKVMPPEEVTDG